MDPDIESVEGFTMHSVDEDDEDDDMAKKPGCFLRHVKKHSGLPIAWIFCLLPAPA